MKFKVFYIIIILYFVFTPILSLADDYIEDSNSTYDLEIEASSDASSVPKINARHAIVFERNSNIILYGKKENETCKMASTTKIMTAIVVIENCSNLNDIVTISKKAARNRWFKIRFIHK